VSEMMAMEMKNDDVRDMLTSEQVLAAIPISRTQLFRLEQDGLFPQGVPLSPRRKLWFKPDVIKWQREVEDPNSELGKAVRSRLHQKPKPGDEA
jgi:prophage regulatory protein